MAELPEPRPDLERRLAALDAELADKRARDARLRTLERDLDPSVGAGWRAFVLMLFAAVLGAPYVVAAFQGTGSVGPRDLIASDLGVGAVVAVATFVGRKHVLGTSFGRSAAS